MGLRSGPWPIYGRGFMVKGPAAANYISSRALRERHAPPLLAMAWAGPQ